MWKRQKKTQLGSRVTNGKWPPSVLGSCISPLCQSEMAGGAWGYGRTETSAEESRLLNLMEEGRVGEDGPVPRGPLVERIIGRRGTSSDRWWRGKVPRVEVLRSQTPSHSCELEVLEGPRHGTGVGFGCIWRFEAQVVRRTRQKRAENCRGGRNGRCGLGKGASSCCNGVRRPPQAVAEDEERDGRKVRVGYVAPSWLLILGHR